MSDNLRVRDEIVVIGTSRYNLVPDHEIDFRGCSNGVPTIDSYDSAISATAVNGATCSASGMVFDGVDDYVDVTPWPFGGALTLEVYLKFDSLDNTEVGETNRRKIHVRLDRYG